MILVIQWSTYGQVVLDWLHTFRLSAYPQVGFRATGW